MGLDMYATSVKASCVGSQQVDVDLENITEDINQDFAYWRKFNHLHGFMETMYRRKGGTKESFNCTNVRLELEDLDLLESLALAKALPPKGGFFFGDYSKFTKKDKETVLDFVKKAKAAIADGQAIFYDSWW